MHDTTVALIDRLATAHSLSVQEYQQLIEQYSPKAAEYAAKLAIAARSRIYGNQVYIRGLIEISNICKNNCLYCGIRRDNTHCERYRLSREEIWECCREGYALGFRTFVMQGGEDPYYTDDFLCPLLHRIKAEFPDCAITLSLGEREEKSYQRLREAGADRYLLRHETANKDHYQKLHPRQMSFDRRMHSLYTLKQLGYQVGCGFMVGSPYQTSAHMAEDLKFIEEFQPHMCGIGPFIPQKDTPFADKSAGAVAVTCYLLSLIRLIKPNILLPSTTALGSIDPFGRKKGILAGANVVMPNLSPVSVRSKYTLYDNKATDGSESAQCKAALEKRMEDIGYQIVTARGDIIN